MEPFAKFQLRRCRILSEGESTFIRRRGVRLLVLLLFLLRFLRFLRFTSLGMFILRARKIEYWHRNAKFMKIVDGKMKYIRAMCTTFLQTTEELERSSKVMTERTRVLIFDFSAVAPPMIKFSLSLRLHQPKGSSTHSSNTRSSFPTCITLSITRHP